MKSGVIYKIEISENNIYVGSTTQMLCRRQAEHNRDLKKNLKRKLYESCNENNIDKIKCIWVADVEYNSTAELRMIEEQYRKELNANLNTNKCYTTEQERIEIKKEYYENNKDKILEQRTEYRQKNKETINEKKKITVKCDLCDTVLCKTNLSRHKKSMSCKNIMKKKS